MPRRASTELRINHERWLISYSDFITLLFAFFVVMYSVSQVNESKYRVLSDTLVQAFGSTPLVIDPIQVGEPVRAVQPDAIDLGKTKGGDEKGDGPFDRVADLPQLSDQFTRAFEDLIDDDLVQVTSSELWLQISLKDSILFSSGEVQITEKAQRIFEDIATILEGYQNPIQVEGHTDNIPVSSSLYPSNWELSAARAAAVVKVLRQAGIEPERLAAVGYGEFQPIAENDTPEGRAQNRRVALMIARDKIDRPVARTSKDVKALVESVKETAEQQGLSAEEKLRAINEQSLDRTGDPPTALDAILSAPAKADTDTPAQEEDKPVNGIKAVKDEDGRLIYSSDPELERRR